MYELKFATWFPMIIAGAGREGWRVDVNVNNAGFFGAYHFGKSQPRD